MRILILMLTMIFLGPTTRAQNTKISALPPLLNADAATGDEIPILDISGPITKNITLAQLDLRWLTSVFTTATSTTGIIYDNEAYAEFQEATGSGDNYVRIQAPATLAGDVVLTLPVDDGNASDVLTTDGAGVLSWAAGGGGGSFTGAGFFDAYAAKTSNYTALATDYVLTGDSSGAAFTFTLPAAGGNTGAILHFVKTDSSLNKIDIGTLLDLDIPNEAVTIVSDGTNWQIVNHHIPGDWNIFTPTSNWAATMEGAWMRVGNTIVVRISQDLTATPSGNWTVDHLPSGLTMDSTAMLQEYNFLNSIWGSCGIQQGANYNPLKLVWSDSDTFAGRVATVSGANITFSNMGPTAPGTWASGDHIFCETMHLPITEWGD